MSEYMTGEELRDVLCEKHYAAWGERYAIRFDAMNERDKAAWNAFADVIKAPRPPKPKTLVETMRQWLEDDSNHNCESEVETLRVLLNEARQKLDGGL